MLQGHDVGATVGGRGCSGWIPRVKKHMCFRLFALTHRCTLETSTNNEAIVFARGSRKSDGVAMHVQEPCPRLFTSLPGSASGLKKTYLIPVLTYDKLCPRDRFRDARDWQDHRLRIIWPFWVPRGPSSGLLLVCFGFAFGLHPVHRRRRRRCTGCKPKANQKQTQTGPKRYPKRQDNRQATVSPPGTGTGVLGVGGEVRRPGSSSPKG